MPSIIDQVLSIARSQIGVHETPGANNHGPEVRQYLAAVGLPEGNPWCAAFVSWVLQRAGVQGWPATGDTWAIRDWARAKGVLHSGPAVGDVFLLLDSAGNPMHTGLVTSVAAGRVGTIEGNTGGPSDTDGDGVYAKSRPADACAYVRWADALAAPPRLLVAVNSHVVECHPHAENGVTRVDLRAIAEALGGTLDTSKLASDNLIAITRAPS